MRPATGTRTHTQGSRTLRDDQYGTKADVTPSCGKEARTEREWLNLRATPRVGGANAPAQCPARRQTWGTPKPTTVKLSNTIPGEKIHGAVKHHMQHHATSTRQIAWPKTNQRTKMVPRRYQPNRNPKASIYNQAPRPPPKRWKQRHRHKPSTGGKNKQLNQHAQKAMRKKINRSQGTTRYQTHECQYTRTRKPTNQKPHRTPVLQPDTPNRQME